jgi:hypothetical protein
VLINNTETWFYLDAAGNVLEGTATAPGGAATLLCAAGGSIDEAEAAKHGLSGRLASHADQDLRNPVTGEPIVLVGGRAFARHLVDPPKPAPVPGRVAPPPAHVAEAKHVAGPAETKADVPAAAPPAPVPGVPAAGPAVNPPAKGNGGK